MSNARASLSRRYILRLPCRCPARSIPTFREYERTVVTAFDAYMKPVVGRYLERLEDGLRAAQVTAPLQIMQSRGGLAGTSVARKRPVRLFLSGPAAGVIGGAIVGRSSGHRELITIDVGGTSSDIALVEGGEPVIRAQGNIAGFPVRVPMVDVNAIGAGGGVDRMVGWRRRFARRPAFRRLRTWPGLLRPRRRGGDGHRCFRGTRLARSRLLRRRLGSARPDTGARRDRTSHRAAAGLSLEDAALGIHRVVNAQMAEGIRLVSIRRGLDPRRFTLVALGGAGPIHATALAAELGILKRAHPAPSRRALGCRPACRADRARGGDRLPAPARRDLEFADVRDVLDELDRSCARLMAEETSAACAGGRYSADVWYVGQSYFLKSRFDTDATDPFGQPVSRLPGTARSYLRARAQRSRPQWSICDVHRAPAASGHLDEGDLPPR